MSLSRTIFQRSTFGLIFLFLSLICFSLNGICYADDISLAWDAPVNSPVPIAGYYIYWGTESGNYINRTNNGVKTTCTIAGLDQNVTYFFAVTSYDRYFEESKYSNEISVNIPTAGQTTTTTQTSGTTSGTTDQTAGQTTTTTQTSGTTSGTTDLTAQQTTTTTQTSGTTSSTTDQTAGQTTTTTQSPVAEALPDLTGTWLSIGKKGGGTQCSIFCTFLVENTGDQRAQDVLVKFYLSKDQSFDSADKFLVENTIQNIKQGTSVKLSLKVALTDIPQDGSNYVLIAVIDPANTVEEKDEENNTIISQDIL